MRVSWSFGSWVDVIATEEKCHFVRTWQQNRQNCMDTQAQQFDFTMMQYKLTMCVCLARRRVFVVNLQENENIVWLCSLFATTQYLKVVHYKIIIFVYHLWEITAHDAFLYSLAQTLSRMYGYLKPCSLYFFLEYKAFQAPKFSRQFFFVFQMSWYACSSCIFIMVYITSVLFIKMFKFSNMSFVSHFLSCLINFICTSFKNNVAVFVRYIFIPTILTFDKYFRNVCICIWVYIYSKDRKSVV